MNALVPRIMAAAMLVVLGAGITWTSVGERAYNSEEHKLIADRGVSAVNIPETVKLPAPVAFKSIGADAYVNGMKASKKLAVGYETNARDAYSIYTEAVQDNCYFTGPAEVTNTFKQSEYNVKLWIPPPAAAPSNVLWVPGHSASGSSAHLFTFGELVAFYGDYRQIPFCDGGKCFVTNGDIPQVRFVPQGGSILQTRDKYCPTPKTPGEYIARIGSGLVPPFGKLGNATDNTAEKGAADYGDAGWWGDEMLRIAKVNDWHFSNIAVAWYVGMHRQALLYAGAARENPDNWVKALHYEANALHSLTDLFAFGHVVTNSDAPSHSIIVTSGLADKPVYRWMEHTLALGGGNRSGSGILELSGTLPELTEASGPRNAYQNTRPSVSESLHKLAEMFYHDTFNGSGATVRNLRGDEFTIFGDGHLSDMQRRFPGAVEVAVGAVTASVQSLFNAYDALAKGSGTVAQLSTDPAFFEALRYLPVYVVHDPDKYFTGRWTLYASAINDMTGKSKELKRWPDCRIQFITGADLSKAVPQILDLKITPDMLRWPTAQNAACTEF